jgi:hypothetical protein
MTKAINIEERDFTSEQRKAAAKSGAAMSDGSFPIENKSDLENAIRAVGRASDPAAAKAHIRKRAKAMGAMEMLPDSWQSGSAQESIERFRFITCEHVSEAVQSSGYDASKGLLTVTVIKPGFSKNTLKGRQRYYPAPMLKRDHKVFEGVKMFADHQTEGEARERPVGSVHNWVASMGSTWIDESSGDVKGTAKVIDPGFKAKLDNLSQAGLLKEMGISIRAAAEVSTATIEGKEAMCIESLISSRSVDFVTAASAGGRVEMMESTNDEYDLDVVDEARLRTRRPDLVELVESSIKEKFMNENQVQELKESVTTLTTQLAAATEAHKVAETKLQESTQAMENVTKKATAATELAKLLSESKLPEQAQAKLKKQFSEALVTEGMKEAIDFERDYIKSFAGTTQVRNLGKKDNGTQQVAESEEKDARSSLEESFIAAGFSEKDAKLAAAGRQPMKIVQASDVASK